jgi:hypothetical protein
MIFSLIFPATAEQFLLQQPELCPEQGEHGCIRARGDGGVASLTGENRRLNDRAMFRSLLGNACAA